MEFDRLKGIAASPGIAAGEVWLTERVIFTSFRESISASQVDKELARLGRAVDRTRQELQQLKGEVKAKIGADHAFIFDAHLLILDDAALRDKLEGIVREEKTKAEWALSQVNSHYRKIFESLKDEYFRERRYDISDVLAKIYANLEQRPRPKEEGSARRILVAHDLLPSEAAMQLSSGQILAVALDTGGTTSHAVILARSLNIPAVVGLHNVTERVTSGAIIIVDGTDGEVIVNPPPAVRKEFLGKKERYDVYRRELRKTAKLNAVTLDGHRFTPMANIELLEEVDQALSLGAEGIGLFRSEFIYLQRTSLPTEEEHFEIYSRLAKAAYPLPVYIRTVDIGGEISFPALKIEKEPNPALGLRAVRLSLKYRDEFRTQIRAILRASSLKNVRILVPMVTEAEEIGEVRLMFEEAKEELRAEKVKLDGQMPLGVMIEVPVAAAMIDVLIQDVDYVSIGTNDLIQYFLAVDRSNEFVSYLYKPLHPAALRLIQFIIETAARAGKDVTVCGEMAADPISALVLLGLGLRKFSMNPIFIPRVKKSLRAVEFKTVRRIVQEAIRMKTAQEVEEYILEKILAKHPLAFLAGQM
ncbi:MAG: phosphoenolpyruvate--protein phosphotransferase [Candidatus Aminicenantes bacterium]|nr:phosphoenolpyruvate--protein phosphotransferase [Candidatus Aminicenantes bacterium]